MKRAAPINAGWDSTRISADASRATMKEIAVIKFGVIHRISTMNQLSTMAKGEVTKDDHHSSFLFFVSHNLANFSSIVVS